MARKRKTHYSQSEWRRIFAEAAKYCAAQARKGLVRYQDCISDYLKKYK